MSLRRHRRALLLVPLALACSRVDDPSLRPVDDPRFEAPPPTLETRPRDPNRNVFWGDLHIHTTLSYDAYTFGVRATPDDAYAYAKGGTIEHALGYPVRAMRPLDFAAVTDHAEYLGAARAIAAKNSDTGPTLREVLATGSRWRITLNYFRTIFGSMSTQEKRAETWGEVDPAIAAGAWQEIQDAAARHDDPGRFTAFVGYEWSSMPDDQNLHRNVIYRSDAVPPIPVSCLESENPEDLWRALDAQREAGMQVLAIPHNSNVSNGLMYARTMYDGSPLTAEYARTRMRNEPISEILQVKGQSETHPVLSTEDEFADFEVWDLLMSASGGRSEPRGSYSRDALETGLELSARDGFNPYRFGVIGSSDGHNATSPVEEAQYHGKLPLLDGTPGMRLGLSIYLPDDQNRGGQWSAMGLAAVWAEENTRADLFDSMRRKETYATSGPRIAVRFFGGWEFGPQSLTRPDRIANAYATGVPMGGDLEQTSKLAAPRFLVMALKDPAGANLDRVQIVKGWVDAEGSSHEKVFDVIASDGRVPDPKTHRCAPVGNTVDIARARYTNDIGAAKLESVWTDPEYDPAALAFYYVRVLEIPTPRWSTYDAVAMGIEPKTPASIQERAVTSAIWVTPAPR